MEKWYFAKENEKKGPVEQKKLLNLIKQQTIKQDDLVWTQGMDDWKKVEDIDLLQAFLNHPEPVEFSYKDIEFAGFWRRLGAWIIDIVLLVIVITIIELILFPNIPNETSSSLYSFLGLIIGWLYYAFSESSDYQATIGKRLIGLKVTDTRKRKISFGKASGRYFGKIISGLILFIGYIMAGFTKKKQALHDIMADCLVVRK